MKFQSRATSLVVPFADPDAWLAGSPRAPAQAAAPAPRICGGLRRLLLATRGTSSTADAVRVAAALARRHEAPVEVLTVFEPRIPYPVTGDPAAPFIELPDRPAADAQLQRVYRFLREAAEQDASIGSWSVSLEVGQTPARIALAAQRREADLVVLGRGRVGGPEWVGDHVALGVAVMSTTPVLAVPAGGCLPRRLMLAVGLDELTLHVARAVRRLFPDLELLDLVHVRRGHTTSDDELDALLARLELVLGYPEERIVRTVLAGEPVKALLAHAARTRPDCIATGLHAVTVAERSLARNLSLHLLDESGTSVLVVPK